MTTAADPARWVPQSEFSDPGRHAARLPATADPAAIGALVRNLLAHYRADGDALDPARLPEADSRWADVLLDVDASRNPEDLAAPRAVRDRVAGCCRDFTLLTVAALRAAGVPARSRIGFAGYLAPDWHHDHVVTEWWDGQRWRWSDTELEPSGRWPFDPLDLPRSGPGPRFESAAEVWLAHRGGRDISRYGVHPDVPEDFLRGPAIVADYVVRELAHRQRDELLLWDDWGPDEAAPPSDLDLVDRLARLLVAADGGDESAEQELVEIYRTTPHLAPGQEFRCFSPVSPPTTARRRRS